MMGANKAAYLTGLSGALVVVLLTLVGGAAFPSYSHTRQYISELGAHGAPHGGWVTFAGFLPAGVLLMLFAGAAAKALPRSNWTTLALWGVGLYAYGYVNSVPFRCDFGCRPEHPSLSQVLHNLGGLMGYLAGPPGLLLIGFQARRWPASGWVQGVAYGGGTVSLLALSGLDPNFPRVGLAQRLIEGGMLAGIVAIALYLRRHPELRRQAAQAQGSGR